MSKKKKKSVPVQVKKKNDNMIGIITSTELLRKSQPIANIPL